MLLHIQEISLNQIIGMDSCVIIIFDLFVQEILNIVYFEEFHDFEDFLELLIKKKIHVFCVK